MEKNMTQLMPWIPQYVVEAKSTTELPRTVSTSRLLSELSDKNYRDAYVAAQIRIGLPFQVKALRTTRDWSQGELAQRADMAQPRISEIERPGERSLNLETLLRLASAFDCALEVKFVPFSELVRNSESFDPATFEIPTFPQELEWGTFSMAPVVPSVVYFGQVNFTGEIVVGPNDLTEYRSIVDFNLVAISCFPLPPISIGLEPEESHA
jgi:transcriptional regulator with XRE-family HTH domain